MIKFPDEAEKNILQIFIDAAGGGDFSIDLYTDFVTLDDNTTFADLDAVKLNDPQALATADYTAITTNAYQQAETMCDTFTWTVASGTYDIYGFFVYYDTDKLLYCAEIPDSPVTLDNTHAFDLLQHIIRLFDAWPCT